MFYGLKQTGDAIRWRKITLHGAEREETNTAAPDCDAPGHDTVGKIPGVLLVSKGSRDLLQHVSRPESPPMAREQ